VPFDRAVPEDMPLDRVQRTLVWWFRASVLVSLGFILVLVINMNVPELTPPLLRRLLLTQENNLAAWWSGMLLFMLAVHAYGASLAQRDAAPAAGPAWGALAGILLFFSADEIGSLHERVADVSIALGLGSWGLVLPLGAVIGAVLLRALWAMWQAGPASRRLVVPLFIGFALLGSVAGQEFLEHQLHWDSALANSIRAALEEGTELFGMIVLLATILPATVTAGGRAPDDPVGVLFLPARHAGALFVAAVLLMPALTAVALAIGEDHRGRLCDWLTTAAFLVPALLALRHALCDDGGRRVPLLALAGVCLLASAAATALGPYRSLDVGGVALNGRLIVLGALCLPVCWLWLTTGREPAGAITRLSAVTVGVWAIFAPVIGNGAPQVFLTTQVLALLVAAGTYVALERPDAAVDPRSDAARAA
jgi:hypothetical protein